MALPHPAVFAEGRRAGGGGGMVKQKEKRRWGGGGKEGREGRYSEKTQGAGEKRPLHLISEPVLHATRFRNANPEFPRPPLPVGGQTLCLDCTCCLFSPPAPAPAPQTVGLLQGPPLAFKRTTLQRRSRQPRGTRIP